MPYIHFTDEQKQRASSVDLVEFLRLQGEKLIRSGPEYRLASDHSITVRGSEWYDHAAELSVGPVSFVQHFYGLSYPEAVTRLLNGEQGVVVDSHSRQMPKVNPSARKCSEERGRSYGKVSLSFLVPQVFSDRRSKAFALAKKNHLNLRI